MTDSPPQTQLAPLKRKVPWVVVAAGATVLIAGAAIVAVFVRQGGSTSSPEEQVQAAVRLHFDTLRNQGFGAAAQNSCREMRETYNKVTAQVPGSGAEDDSKADITVDKVENIKVEGEVATVKVTGTEDGHTESNLARLLKENGTWKMCTLPE